MFEDTPVIAQKAWENKHFTNLAGRHEAIQALTEIAQIAWFRLQQI